MIHHPDKFFIDGQWQAASTDARFEIVTPSTEEVFLRVAEAQEADINRAVDAAKRAFDTGPWPRMSHGERAGYLKKIAMLMQPRTGDLSNLWTSEIGVACRLANGWMGGIPSLYDYYASLADSFPFIERHQAQTGKLGLLVREPVGVVGAIIPWNGPAVLIAQKLAPALLAGCTVILKCSPEAPSAGYLFAEVVEAAGLPPGVVNVVTADREVSELLVRHPDVDKITFTGSSAAGKRIGSLCGARVARCTLELGGKSAAIVLDDYDVEKVASAFRESAPAISGQVCASLTRIVVSRDRHDDLVEAIASAFRSINVGDPFDEATDMGPLAMRRQRDRVEGYFEKARAEGATVATGATRPPSLNRGYYVEPTVFANVSNDMSIAREEIFGPVVSVIPADSEQQALQIANDTSFGLNASVFTNDAGKAYRMARELRSGTVGHNGQSIELGIAFGGFKQSGIGREGGTEGLLPFLETKTLVLQEEPEFLAKEERISPPTYGPA